MKIIKIANTILNIVNWWNKYCSVIYRSLKESLIIPSNIYSHMHSRRTPSFIMADLYLFICISSTFWLNFKFLFICFLNGTYSAYLMMHWCDTESWLAWIGVTDNDWLCKFDEWTKQHCVIWIATLGCVSKKHC